jgi:hypothetical protein
MYVTPYGGSSRTDAQATRLTPHHVGAAHARPSGVRAFPLETPDQGAGKPSEVWSEGCVRSPMLAHAGGIGHEGGVGHETGGTAHAETRRDTPRHRRGVACGVACGGRKLRRSAILYFRRRTSPRAGGSSTGSPGYPPGAAPDG